MLGAELGDGLPHVVRDVLVEVHHEVADVRIGREDLAEDVRVAIGDDAVDVAEHAGHVLVHVEDAVRARRAARARRCGKFTAPVVAPGVRELRERVATSRPIASCASAVEPPMCGVSITFGSPRTTLSKSSLLLSGSSG